ncbi:MAG TPA: DUF4235 domain-containing protein [Acidimicrobiales bacterium]|jgi:hypothetical protein
MGQRMMWRIVGSLAVAAAGIVARQALVATWRATRGTDPPTNPAATRTSWGEALAWSVASGVAFGVARMVAVRGAAAAWRKATGSYPEDLEAVKP